MSDLMRSGRSEDSIDHIVVVIPAHNEQQRIGKAVRAATRAARRVASRASCAIVVVADACSDRTEAVASARLTGGNDLVIETNYGKAGAARRAGTNAALALGCHSLHRTWIASTDADSVVPRDWLTKHLEAASGGLDGITGVVTLTDDCDLDGLLLSRFDSYYELDPDGSHRHVHAANLGLRASAYCAIGGWLPMATGEDHDLWTRLGNAGYRRGSSTELVVSTSARRRARAPDGFAADLVALDAARGAA